MQKTVLNRLNSCLGSATLYYRDDIGFNRKFIRTRRKMEYVYVLFNYGQPIYVGRTKRIYSRILMDHKQNKQYTHFYLFETFNFLCEIKKGGNDIVKRVWGGACFEALLIDYFNPTLNVVKHNRLLRFCNGDILSMNPISAIGRAKYKKFN